MAPGQDRERKTVCSERLLPTSCFPLCRLPEAEEFCPGRKGDQFLKGVSSHRRRYVRRGVVEMEVHVENPELLTDLWKSGPKACI